MFSRFISLVGEENFNKIRSLKVMVIGVGGVGGYTVESLARCNVGKLILVDYDEVAPSNINRQVIATKETIGKKKVEAFKTRVETISDTKVIPVASKFDASLLDKYEIDYVVDACDDISAKNMIIKECLERKIPFISSMGTGKRLDPSKLVITTLNKTSYDPIARILRKFVRDEKIKGKITVLSSLEAPIKTDSKEIPSCSFVPSSAGLLITSHIIQNIIKSEN